MLPTWTDLTIMIYMVPLVISALAVMIFGAADNLASYAGFHCDECGAKFDDESALNRHIKKTKEAEEVRVPEFKEVA
ncbi:MAG: C2H2-type zinc finger protein [Deltaproteobacteria bacterium]|nr:C2H2-type zinc finger protein [Deltaproteobacteria bacterium]